MHPNLHFHYSEQDTLVSLVEANPFAVIIGIKDGRAHTAHTPVLISNHAEGPRLRFHLAHHNRACLAIEESGEALIIFTGPNAYISPDWYAAPDKVPTWNYISAEAEGPVRSLPDDETTQFLDDLSDHFEQDLAPKPIWRRDKMSPDRFETLQRAIVAFELTPNRFEGTRKLSQNKPDEARMTAAKFLNEHDPGNALAKLMTEIK